MRANTLIIGASAAGLATAACLKKENIDFVILEKQNDIGHAWRNHYDRLHLHTSKKWSALPYKKFDDHVPAYPSRQDVIDYLDTYAIEFKIEPVFNTEVYSLRKQGEEWVAETSKGIYRAGNMVLATGLNHTPYIPVLKGQENFNGKILHSSAYKNGKEFKGQEVLILGFGNSACEQAICLHEHGAFPSMAVRSPVNVLPRDIFGFPVLEIGKITSIFSARTADKLNAPLINYLIGDITKWGLKKSAYGPKEQIEKLKRIPLLDIGTMDLIRKGFIKIFGNIDHIEGNTVYFENNKQKKFDAIILATGYIYNLKKILGDYNLPNLDNPRASSPDYGQDGIYFCGFYVSPMGMLREISLEAMHIAKHIKSQIKFDHSES